MNRLILHVVPAECNKRRAWRIKLAENSRTEAFGDASLTKTYTTKKEAVYDAVRLCKANKPSQVKIHKNNGVFQSERTYGNDPRKYVG